MDSDTGIRQEKYHCIPYVQKVKLRHEKYKRTQIELLEMKMTIPEMRNIPGINSRKNINKHEDTAVQTIQNETQRVKRI